MSQGQRACRAATDAAIRKSVNSMLAGDDHVKLRTRVRKHREAVSVLSRVQKNETVLVSKSQPINDFNGTCYCSGDLPRSVPPDSEDRDNATYVIAENTYMPIDIAVCDSAILPEQMRQDIKSSWHDFHRLIKIVSERPGSVALANAMENLLTVLACHGDGGPFGWYVTQKIDEFLTEAYIVGPDGIKTPSMYEATLCHAVFDSTRQVRWGVIGDRRIKQAPPAPHGFAADHHDLYLNTSVHDLHRFFGFPLVLRLCGRVSE